jgi:CHASE3 domain sensor protein
MSEQEILQEIMATLQRMEKQQDDELRRQAKERSKALQPQRKLSGVTCG